MTKRSSFKVHRSSEIFSSTAVGPSSKHCPASIRLPAEILVHRPIAGQPLRYSMAAVSASTSFCTRKAICARANRGRAPPWGVGLTQSCSSLSAWIRKREGLVGGAGSEARHVSDLVDERGFQFARRPLIDMIQRDRYKTLQRVRLRRGRRSGTGHRSEPVGLAMSSLKMPINSS